MSLLKNKHFDSIALPEQADWNAHEANILSGNALVITINSTIFMRHYAEQGAVTGIGDELLYQPKQIRAGTYTLEVWGYTDTNKGIADYYVGGLYVGSLDWWSSPGVLNVRKTIAGISLVNSLVDVRSIISGKNASSTSYGLPVVRLRLYRTGA